VGHRTIGRQAVLIPRAARILKRNATCNEHFDLSILVLLYFFFTFLIYSAFLFISREQLFYEHGYRGDMVMKHDIH
jgi:hypothetical protein